MIDCLKQSNAHNDTSNGRVFQWDLSAQIDFIKASAPDPVKYRTPEELVGLALDLDALMGDYATSFFATCKSQEGTLAPDSQKGIF